MAWIILILIKKNYPNPDRSTYICTFEFRVATVYLKFSSQNNRSVRQNKIITRRV